MTRPSSRLLLNAELLSAGMLSVVAEGLRFVANVGMFFALVRLLSPSEFGTLSLAYAISMLVVQLDSFGLREVLLQRRDDDATPFGAYVGAAWLVGAVTTALYVLASYGLSHFYRNPELWPLGLLFTVSVLCQPVAGILLARLAERRRFHAATLVTSLTTISSDLLAVALVYAGFSYWGVALARSMMAVVKLGLLAVVVRESPFASSRLTECLAPLGEAKRLLQAKVASIVFSTADRLILGRVVTAQALGLYSAAWRLAYAPITIVVHAGDALSLPVLARVAHDPARVQRMAHRILTTTYLVLVPFYAALAASAEPLLDTLLGSQWSGLHRYLWLVIPSVIVQPYYSLLNNHLLSQGENALYSRLNLAALVAFLSALLVGLAWGIEGVLVARIATVVGFVPVYGLAIARRYPGFIGPVLGRLAFFCATTAIAAGAGLATGLIGPGQASDSMAIAVAVSGAVSVSLLMAAPPSRQVAAGLWLALCYGKKRSQDFGLMHDEKIESRPMPCTAASKQ